MAWSVAAMSNDVRVIEPLDHPDLSVLERLQTAIWITNTQEVRIVWANVSALAIWRAESLSELINRDNSNASETARQTLAHIQRRVNDGHKLHSQRTIYPLGEPVLVDMSLSAFGPNLLLVEARELERDAVDVDVLRGAETARYAPLGLASFCMQGSILQSNAYLRGHFGSPQYFCDLFPDEGEARLLLAKIQRGEDLVCELELQTASGSRWFLLRTQSLPDPVTGEKIFAASLQDLSIRQENVQLHIHNQALRRSNEELSAFAAVASHDLKSPLAAISQHASFAADSLRESEPELCAEHLRYIGERAANMAILLGDFLSYARSLEHEEDLEEIELDDLMREVHVLLMLPEEYQLQCDFGHVSFWLHVTPLKQVLLNLLSNAIKHHHAPDQMCISTVIERHNDRLNFTISDNGPGIPVEEQERIFGLFQTIKRRDARHGVGMGLALVKKLTEQYGGKIELQSAVGVGSQFLLQWPLQR